MVIYCHSKQYPGVLWVFCREVSTPETKQLQEMIHCQDFDTLGDLLKLKLDGRVLCLRLRSGERTAKLRCWSTTCGFLVINLYQVWLIITRSNVRHGFG